MSHQTGIKANEKLIKIFGRCKNSKIRLIKVSIKNEELCFTAAVDVNNDWERDYDKMIAPLIEADVPCYILYRLDTRMATGYAWLLINWVPDTATIRQKMVYASTKATLKTEFGSGSITEELHANVPEEVTLEGYYRNKRAFAAPAPLTMREEELAELKKAEVFTEVNTESRHQTLSGIACPISCAVAGAVEDLLKGSYNYLQFRIDLGEEEIILAKADMISLAALPGQIPNDHARYHLFLFKHTHEGDYQEAIVFIYSMPGYSCSVRERMMYSSYKGPFVENLQAFGLEITKKLEIDSGAELTKEFLQNELYPKKILQKPAFDKPKGPPKRGSKRMTYPQEHS